MAGIINLRLARKAKARAAAEGAAAANRARHGQTKAERKRLTREAERASHQVDGAKRDPSN